MRMSRQWLGKVSITMSFIYSRTKPRRITWREEEENCHIFIKYGFCCLTNTNIRTLPPSFCSFKNLLLLTQSILAVISVHSSIAIDHAKPLTDDTGVSPSYRSREEAQVQRTNTPPWTATSHNSTLLQVSRRKLCLLDNFVYFTYLSS